MRNKAVLVTGAGSGIGQAIATRLSTDGYFVYLVGRSIDKLKQTQGLCPNPTTLLSLDLSQNDVMSQITQAIESQQNKTPLWALINNAAIFHRLSFHETELDIWELQFQNTLMSAIRTTKACIPFLQKSQGHIVNISSTLGSRPIQNVSAYSAMKAGLNNWTKSLALELASQNIKVNAIEPGLVDTPIHDFHTNTSPELKKQLDASQPLGRVGQPNDIAQAVAFLIGGENSWMTGAIFPVDGGISL